MTIATKNEIEIVGRERLTPAIQVAKKFIGKSNTRPALKYLAIMSNGEIHATNSRIAIVLKNIHSYKEELLLNPKTLELVKGYNFPNLNGVTAFSEKNIKAKITFNRHWLDSLIEALKFFKTAKHPDVDILFESDSITVSSFTTSITVRRDDEWEFIPIETEEPYKAIFYSSDLPILFEGFLDFSNLDTIDVYYQGPMRPLVMENADMTMIALPIRRY